MRLATLRRLSLVFALAAGALLPARSEAAILAPGETLRVTFGFSEAPRLPGSQFLPPDDPRLKPDALLGILDAEFADRSGAPSVRIELLDGTRSLGAYDLQFDGFTSFGFSGPGGLFDFRSGRASDFSTIADGTIAGVLLFTNTSAAPGASGPRFDLNPGFLRVGHAVSAQQILVFDGGPTIRSQERVTEVPEPASAALVLAGLLGLGLARRRGR